MKSLLREILNEQQKQTKILKSIESRLKENSYKDVKIKVGGKEIDF